MAALRSAAAAGAPRKVLALWPPPLLLLLLLLLSLSAAATRMMPGGLMPQPVSDPGVQKAARFAMEAYNQASNSMYYSRMLRVLSAKSQVVEGIKYYLTVELVNTRCEKKGGALLNHASLERCALPPVAEQQKQICEFQVWSRPWLNDTRLLSLDCKPS